MRLVEFAESPRTFHGRDLPADPTFEIWWNRLTEPALVLGSTQRDESIVDAEACRSAGVDVVRRRSGGGAVLLLPGEVVWFDVIIPTGALPQLSNDVHAPMLWLGELLADALGAQVDGEAEGELTVKGPGMFTTEWSSLLCFDGFGPGEVLLDARKLVGISQRRTRTAARLQCCWYRQYDPSRLVTLFAEGHRPPVDQLQPIALCDTPDAAVRQVLGALGTSARRV